MKERFREDLFYRLNVIPIDVVPLRQRGEDIILLFNHFLEYFSNDMGIPAPTVDPKALDILMNYKWPGNVRELRNVVQRLVLNNTDHIGVKEVSDPMILKNSPLSKDIIIRRTLYRSAADVAGDGKEFSIEVL